MPQEEQLASSLFNPASFSNNITECQHGGTIYTTDTDNSYKQKVCFLENQDPVNKYLVNLFLDRFTHICIQSCVT